MKLNLSVKNIIQYVAVALFIVCSGSCIGIVCARYFDLIFVFTTFVLCLYTTRKFSQKNLAVLFLFLLIYISSYLVNIKFTPNINAYFSYFIRLTGTFFLLSALTQQEFEEKYVNTLHIVNLFGLLAYALVINTEVRSYLTYVESFPLLGPFNFVKLHEERNSGIFWEPGAYQLFILYALTIIFRKSDWQILQLKNKFKVAVCILSLLSTKSTTGYLLLAGFAIFFLVKNWSSLPKISKILTVLPVLMLIGGCIYFVMGSSVVQSKFISSNMSYAIRLNDLVSSFDLLIQEYPILGLGYESSMLKQINASRSIGNNSVGLTAEALSIGIIYVISFIYIMFKNVKRAYFQEYLLLWSILAVMFFAEDFFMYPIFFMWLFRPRKKKNLA